ncbi:MAG: NAD(P)-dependent oxidoreductase [Vicinamibacterales bacterium]
MTVPTLADDLDHILDRTEPLWREIGGERLFITGGTGFFGRWLLESLVHANARLGLQISAVVLTRNAGAFRRDMPALVGNAAIAFHEGDLAHFTFPDGTFSHVLHMGTTASVATFNNETPLAKFANIVTGTERTLEFSVHCGASKFLLTSSGAMYGRQPSNVSHLAEDQGCAADPTLTSAAVGHSKRTAEFLTAAYGEQHGFDATIARCFSFVGRHLPLDIHYAIGNFMRDAISGGPIEVRGDGTPRRSYLYAADLVIWLMTILRRGAAGRAYNVGSEDDVSIAELASRVARQAPSPVAVRIARAAAASAPDRYVPSTQRAQQELGLRQSISLDEAIARTLRDILPPARPAAASTP